MVLLGADLTTRYYDVVLTYLTVQYRSVQAASNDEIYQATGRD